MNEELQEIVMGIIINSGSCRSYAMEAIKHAKEKEFQKAEESLEMAEQEILKAHKVQTDLIQKEAGGQKTEVSLLFVHCQDHLMTAMLCKDLAREFIDVYKKI